MSGKSLSDLERLLVSARRGEGAAKDDLFRGLHPIARAAAIRRLGGITAAMGRIEADDVANEATSDLAVRFDTIKAKHGIRSIVALLRKIAARKSLERMRFERLGKRDYRRERPATGDVARPMSLDPASSIVADELRAWICRRCGHSHLAVVDLRVEGYTFDEIAERTGTNERTARRMIDDVRAAVLAARE